METPHHELQTNTKTEWANVSYQEVPPAADSQWPDTDHRQQCDFVINSLNASDFKTYQEVIQRYPMAKLFQISSNPSHFVASVFDRTTQGWKYSQRVLTDQNSDTFEHLSYDTPYLYVDTEAQTAEPRNSCDQLKGEGISVRVLMVVHGGWLVYFGTRNSKTYLLTERQYLVFTGSGKNVIYRRVFDGKRQDMRELFLKINTLRTGDEYDGMTIFRGIVQQDTEGDGTYVINGEGNAILPMRQIQRMMTSNADDTNGQPPTPGMAPTTTQDPAVARPSPIVHASTDGQPPTPGIAPTTTQDPAVERPSPTVHASTGARSKTS